MELYDQEHSQFLQDLLDKRKYVIVSSSHIWKIGDVRDCSGMPVKIIGVTDRNEFREQYRITGFDPIPPNPDEPYFYQVIVE